MDSMLRDCTFITDETFDFDPCSSSDSSDEEEVSLYCPSPVSRLVGHPVNMNVKSKGESTLLLQWSPLSAQNMEEITREANRLAIALEKENMGKNSSRYQSNSISFQHKIATIYSLENQTEVSLRGEQLQHFSTSVALLKDTPAPNQISSSEMSITSHGPQTLFLSKSATSLRSPRRETYVIKDSPNRSFLPNVDLVTPPIVEHHELSYENTPEKVKNGSGAVRDCVSQGRPKSQNPGGLSNVRTRQLHPCPVGRFSADKTSTSHVRASYRPCGTSAAKTHLPIPKSSGTLAYGNTKQSGQRVVSGAVRPSAQRGSLLRPPSHFSAHTKLILKPPR
ncbi:uncharacterized protein LOC128475328 [Spea bombifrons]|uniref:uncharacterized protein LOC128475328 n=1 Tax=Spea bombifrons TaxID=233779 RepID=UPI00234A837F|nr:uncharacterized protein LOC128475328 [Spea bombifrons]